MSLSNYKNLGRIILLPLILGIVPISGYSQWVDPSNGAVVEPTATMSQFMRYGNTPVSLYTGSVDVSVPIYIYEDYEFNIPVVLKYVFSGQKPNDPAGSFGLGWVMNAGGCITRQANHSPDDCQNLESGHADEAYGFYYLHKNNLEIPSIYSSTYPSGNNLGNELYTYFYPIGGAKYEAEPDIFSFNFLGHSGKFLFWEKNKIVVYETSDPVGNYSVEPVMTGYKFTGFIIKTKDGYTYTFGCNSDLYLNDDMYCSDQTRNTMIKNTNAPHVMWPLVSVQSPSGRVVRFEYEKSAERVVTLRPTSYIVESDSFVGTTGREIEWLHMACMSQQEQKNLYLKKISLSNTFSIDFTYSGLRKVEKGYNMNRGLFPITTEGLLQSVVVKDLSNGSTVKTATCSYSAGRPNNVPILKSVYLSDTGSYEFNYWYEDDSSMANYWTPYKGTCSIDHWGYSNGKDNDSQNSGVSYFIPTSSLDNNNTETITSSQRNPDFKYALCGAIRYIFYPTKGKTEFIYEPNDYSVAIIKSGKSSGTPYAEYYESNMIAGGIRIKQIVDYDYNPRSGLWNDTMRVRTYDYHVDGKSTGVLLRSPRYKTSHVKTGASSANKNRRYVASSDILDCIDTDHHIEYSVVKEINRDGSYSKYSYSTYVTPPGSGGIYNREDDMGFLYQTSFGIIGDPYTYLYMRPGSYKMMRGKICSKVQYQAKQNPGDPDIPSYGEYYYYTGPGNPLWAIRMTRYYWYRQIIYAGNCYMNHSIKTNYFGGKQLDVHTYYQYDYDTGYLTQVETSEPTGKRIRQDVYYASMNKGPFPVRTHFQVCMPGETEYKTTEINKYEYWDIRVTPSFVIPRMVKHWKSHLDKPKKYTSEVDQDADLALEMTMQPDASRVREYVDRAGNVTTYLYGDGGCNLLAVVKNVSYNDVSAVLQSPARLGKYNLTSTQEAALRNIPGAVVTTYSYTPLTGLASVTDPSGSKQTYAYDTFRRLAKIYTGGNLEQEFKYQLYNLR